MKMKAFFFVVLYVSCVVSHGEAVYKCDPKVEEAIKKYWGGNVPKNIIAANEAAGLEAVEETTTNYFAVGTKCVSSLFKGDKVYITTVPKEGNATTNAYVTEESEGKTFSPGSPVAMYQVFNEGGVRCVYKCNTSEKATKGNAEGMIKVSQEKFDIVKLEKAKEVSKEIGLVLTEKFPTKCP